MPDKLLFVFGGRRKVDRIEEWIDTEEVSEKTRASDRERDRKTERGKSDNLTV